MVQRGQALLDEWGNPPALVEPSLLHLQVGDDDGCLPHCCRPACSRQRTVGPQLTLAAVATGLAAAQSGVRVFTRGSEKAKQLQALGLRPSKPHLSGQWGGRPEEAQFQARTGVS